MMTRVMHKGGKTDGKTFAVICFVQLQFGVCHAFYEQKRDVEYLGFPIFPDV